MQLLLAVLILSAALVFVQCGISADIDWVSSACIAAMMIVNGYPYILSIPAIWDRALKHTARNMLEGNVLVQNEDAIEEVASLDYLCVQSISVLDKEHDKGKLRR